MVGREELPNAVALNSSLFNAARVVGPAAGGIVVALAGVGVCFLTNTVSFAAVLAGLLMMRGDEMFPRRRERRAALAVARNRARRSATSPERRRCCWR